MEQNDLPLFPQKPRKETGDSQKVVNDSIYSQLLYDMKERDQPFSGQLGLKPLQTFSGNFEKYNYARGYHYFYDLNTFPRMPGSVSYALDISKHFHNTFSHEQQAINGTKIKSIINRKYVSLPLVEITFDDKQSKDKNVCHYHLDVIQDKKYHNTRLIEKYKYVLKNLDKLHESNKLQYFTEIQKDVVTCHVCDKQTPLKKKRQILFQKIKLLERRVNQMIPFWDWEDNHYFHFSLDQLFHNQAMAKGQKLSEKHLRNYISKRIAYRKKYIENRQFGILQNGKQKLRNAIQQWMIFEQENNNALSTLMQNRLKSLPKVIQMFRRNEELIIFPLFTFNLGSKQIQRFIDPLIKAKLQKYHKSCFYVYKQFVKRILKRDLACQEQEVVQPMNMQVYTKQMRQKLRDIEKFYKKQIVSRKKVLFADDIVQFKKLQDSPIEERVHLLQQGHKIDITFKQLMLLFFYRNISIALEQFIEYLNHDPEILKFMADQKYDYFHYGIAKILHQPEFCILINDVTRFSQILSSQLSSPEFDKQLCFHFSEKLRIAYAWKQSKKQKWEIIQSQKTQGDSAPRKKVKI